MIPASFAQTRLWLLDQVDHGPTYNIPVTFRLTGRLDAVALEAAFRDVITRHEPLRTRYRDVDGVPHQDVAGAGGPGWFSLQVETVREERVPGLVAETAAVPFDLARDLPLRVRLLRTAPDRHVLVLVVHHIACDGWSLRPLCRDLSVAYAARRSGRAPEWDPLPVEYGDYTRWQRELLGDRHDPESLVNRQLDFWRETLRGIPEEITLPTDRRRPPVAGHHGARVLFSVPAESHARLADAAREQSATLFMALQVAVATLLCRLGSGTDIPIGSAVAGRTDEALDDLVGMFVNTLVLRTDLSGSPSFASLLAQARERTVAALEHQDVPFEQVVEEVAPVRSMSRNPLVQVMLTLQNNQGAALDLTGLAAEFVPSDVAVAKVDLNFEFTERWDESGHPAGVDGVLFYATDLFDEATARTLTERLLRILHTAADNPHTPVTDIDILSPEERHTLLHTWNDTANPVPPTTLPHLFETHAHTTPHHTAVTHDGQPLTYEQLNNRANQLAHLLRQQGAGPETTIALAIPRSIDMITTLLAITKTGAAYLPIDTEYPTARIHHILNDARPHTLITTTHTQPHLPTHTTPHLLIDHPTTQRQLHHQPTTDLTDQHRTTPLHPEHPAYLIYTSGSTGHPKAVQITHDAAVNCLTWMQDDFPLSGTDRLLQKTSSSFDPSVFEFFWTLFHGATMVLADPDRQADPHYLGEVIQREKVTVVMLVPSLLRAVVAEGVLSGCDSLRRIICGGEPFPEGLDRTVRETIGASVVNMYGPTELTIHITSWNFPHSTDVVPIGSPVFNSRVFVLDEFLQPVPPGSTGELYVASRQMARGYAGRPGLTAERFLACPYPTTPGERMYRTGDLVRWNDHGQLEFIGRADGQIKIRGYRIETAEIENTLTQHPTVQQAIVTTTPDPHDQPQLTAYITATPHTTPNPHELRTHLTTHLPRHMIPTTITTLDHIPLTPNGKIDHKALPQPQPTHHTTRPPRTPQEHLLAQAFTHILNTPTIGIDDNFFDLGGHSLTAAQLVHHLHTTHNINITIRTLFEHPTIAQLTHHLTPQDHEGPLRPPVAVRERPKRPPLSSGQRRLWFMDQVEGPSPTYNMPVAFRLDGEPDTAALRAALADVAGRHETLRTVFGEADGTPYQRVLAPDEGRPELVVTAVSREELSEAVSRAAHQCFDLARDVPLRAHLLSVTASEHVLVLVLHHIAGDGWSLRPLLGDLAQAYAARRIGRAPDWRPLPVQYTDYALWQDELFARRDDPEGLPARQIAYWTRELAGLEPEPDLIPAVARPRRPSHEGDGVPVVIRRELHARLELLARECGASLFMVLQAAFAVLLSRVGNATDVAIGVPVAGRTDPALRDLVGMFVNTLVLRTDVSGDPSFADLVAQVREKNLAAHEHQDLPFDHLVEVLRPERSVSRHPLFQVMLTLDNTADAPLDLPGLSVSDHPVASRVARFDMTLNLVDRRDAGQGAAGVEGFLRYATDLFDEATARTLTERLLRILHTAADNPHTPVTDIDILSPEERHTLLHTWNDTANPVPPTTLPHLFETQAHTTPHHTAVTHDGQHLTYEQLNNRANQLAHLLRQQGAGPETTIALAIPRSIDMITTLLAITKTGAAYLPIDTEYPTARIHHILNDARPHTLITTTHTQPHLPTHTTPHLLIDHPTTQRQLHHQPTTDLTDQHRTTPLHPEHPAYLIYTSGSTGHPKAVQITHDAAVNCLTWMQDDFPLSGTDRLLQKTSSSFDPSVFEFFWTLFHGATMVLADPDRQADPHYLGEVIQREKVTVVMLVPSLLRAVVAEGVLSGCDSLRRIICGGEPFPEGLDRTVRETIGASVVNMYGPTELTIHITSWNFPHSTDVVPIGSPVFNSRVFVLDEFLQPVPPGSTGELYVASRQMARGYAGRPGLTAERFLACPYPTTPGERMYRTGDLVRWNDHGQLEFIGRADGQIKIRGYRIETAEIENTLTQHPTVQQAIVTTTPDPHDQPQLTAYITATPHTTPNPHELRTHLTTHLPRHMIPTTITTLDHIPLTPNGKIDHKALPQPQPTHHTTRPPRTPQEHLLAQAFTHILNTPTIGIDDNFFDLGGHSLTAAQLVHHLHTTHNINITIRTLFEHPTIAQLTHHLTPQDHEEDNALEVLLPIRTQGDGSPLFCVHPAGGLSWVYSRLLRYLPADQTLYGLQARGLARPESIPGTVEEIARDYARQIRRAHPRGPYRLLGWSFGGVIAQAMAVQLQEENAEVEFLALLDSYPTADPADLSDSTALMADMVRSIGLMLTPEQTAEISPREILRYMREMRHPLRHVKESSLLAMMEDYRNARDSKTTHTPRVYRGELLAFTATRSAAHPGAMTEAWSPYVDGRITEHPVDCRHEDMMMPGHLDAIASVLRAGLGG
ncbi:amino acid adenylation domain-containing protein [Streptomyces flaveolus]|uniref:amino acid adenylation domain-containing protein n=1 Tax=Streptomyces flaveolus TaxID=67297 RepID=UPI0034124F72